MDVWIVEWCSTGEQQGQLHVATLADIVRTNMQVFSGLRAAKYNDKWIAVGAFYTHDQALDWLATLRELYDSGRLFNKEQDFRVVPQPVTNPSDLAHLKSTPYEDYLQTDYWQRVRKEVLRCANYRCQICNADAPLGVHHRAYDSRGEETWGDVAALCRDCHSKFHGKGHYA